MAAGLTKADIERLFTLLDADLAAHGVEAELYLVGGAVMCLALAARDATKDVDGLFKPARAVREAAARVAERAGIPPTWLNDAVKGYLSPKGAFDPFLELPSLRVFVAQPSYLLAMKCAAMRLGEEFHDLEDVRYCCVISTFAPQTKRWRSSCATSTSRNCRRRRVSFSKSSCPSAATLEPFIAS